MSDPKSPLEQENFAARRPAPRTGEPDFASDAGALAYAEAQLGELVEAMRHALREHVAAWPGDDRELNTHEALRHLLRDLNLAHAAYMEADYENPQLTKLGATSRIQFQLPSPDCQYHTALLHGDHVYRLRGPRGSAAVFQTTVYRGHACDLVDWKTHSNASNYDTPAYAPGATLDVVLSRERPGELGRAHWLELPAGPCELHVRQYYGDWEREQPADLALTLERPSFPAALLTRETAELRFRRVIDLLRVHADFYRAGVQAHLDADPERIPELVIPGAFEGTRYFNGHFRCRPDQAAILEIDAPEAPYWNMALYQLQYEPGDWWARLSSYNSSQVAAEPDGRVRWVASWRDPGVPNWLDCSGRVLHLVAFRFFRPARAPTPPRVRTVPLDELARELPDAIGKVSPEARHDLLRRRLDSVIRRRMTDF